MSMQKLFNHMSQEHHLTLLNSEMDEIFRICKADEWKQRSPPEDINNYILIFHNGKIVPVIYTIPDYRFVGPRLEMYDTEDITHWRYLPTPP